MQFQYHIKTIFSNLILHEKFPEMCLLFAGILHLLLQNPKSQEPVTLDFLDAELENDIKVEVSYANESLPSVVF